MMRANDGQGGGGRRALLWKCRPHQVGGQASTPQGREPGDNGPNPLTRNGKPRSDSSGAASSQNATVRMWLYMLFRAISHGDQRERFLWGTVTHQLDR
jgi:hypothetical protein